MYHRKWSFVTTFGPFPSESWKDSIFLKRFEARSENLIKPYPERVQLASPFCFLANDRKTWKEINSFQRDNLVIMNTTLHTQLWPFWPTTWWFEWKTHLLESGLTDRVLEPLAHLGFHLKFRFFGETGSLIQTTDNITISPPPPLLWTVDATAMQGLRRGNEDNPCVHLSQRRLPVSSQPTPSVCLQAPYQPPRHLRIIFFPSSMSPSSFSSSHQCHSHCHSYLWPESWWGWWSPCRTCSSDGSLTQSTGNGQ